MAIIDNPSFSFDGRHYFAVEYPQRNLSSNTQLNVKQGQEALFLLGGQIEKKYPPSGARPYTLDSANIPVVRRLFGIPFGGSNPIEASVWFINKADIVNMEVETATFLLKDPGKAQGFPAVATVNFGVKVTEAEPFFIKLVNGKSPFAEEDIVEALHGRIKRIVSEKVAQLVDQLQLTFADINTRLSFISDNSRMACASLLDEWGLEFADFNVTVAQDTNKEGLMMASGYGTDMASFERQRILDIQERAISNLSDGGNGLLGAVLAMGMVNQMGQTMQPNQLAQQAQGAPQGEKPEVKEAASKVYCANCGCKYDTSDHYCPRCGKEYKPCPRCGSDTVAGSRRCVNCGAALHTTTPQQLCAKCSGKIPAGAAFCPNCGNPVGKSASCKKCGYKLNGEKFCPNCGTKNE